ncbi:MAG TPA: glycosyltransferase [Ohtaekwangia sp.]
MVSSKGLDVIWLSLDRVDNKYSSTSYSLAKELSKTNRVFFVDNPATYGELIKKTGKDASDVYTKVSGTPEKFLAFRPHRTWPVNWLNKEWLYTLASAVNNQLFMASLRRLIRDQRINDFVFVNVFDPFYARTFAKDINPRLKVYYSVDDIRHSPYVAKHGPRLEQEIVKNYDLTLTTSRQLQTLLSAYGNNVQNLPNAADIALFKTVQQKTFDRPEELQGVNNPVIVYTGHLDWRVDIPLLMSVAERNPDKVLLLVGPVSVSEETLSALKRLPNVIQTGSKPIELLPSYLQYSHCAIIPFKCNTLTESIYPLKINEYLAAGLPVVSTSFSLDIRQFENVIALENQIPEFNQAIQLGVETDTTVKKAERVRAAEKNSWPARAEMFWELVNKNINR